MQEVDKIFEKLILVCTNDRTDGRECCARKGSFEFYQTLKNKMKEVNLGVRVSRTGCLGHCSTGTTVAIMPDNKWFGGVTMDDIDGIISSINN